MLVADDYAPVTTPEDEEEERRRREDAYAPVPAPNTSVIPAYAKEPTIPPDLAVASPHSLAPLNALAPTPITPAPVQTPAQTRLRGLTEQGAPPVQPLHGFKKGLDIFGQIVRPDIEQRLRYRPQHEYAANLKQAESDVAAEQAPEAAAAKEAQEKATTEKTKAETEALRNPQPKVGLTPEEQTMNDLLHGDNGNARINPETKKPYTYPEALQSVKAASTTAKRVPVGDAPAKQYNDSILRELNVNPNTAQKAIPPEYEVKPGDTDAEAKEKLQRAKDLVGGATGQQKIIVQEGQYGTSRADKSYDRQAKRLDDARKPVDETVRRMGRLIDTLNQQSPQADALVGPELLSVMSGGQGSGLRMNEAEIARIIGGRSAWESLKAAIQHWSTNPEDARSITPDQDKQIRTLIETVHQKLIKKQQILDKASDDLLEADDVGTHRKIVTESQKALDAIDAGETTAGTGGNEPPRPAHVPKDYVYQENGPKGKGWYKPTPKGQ